MVQYSEVKAGTDDQAAEQWPASHRSSLTVFSIWLGFRARWKIFIAAILISWAAGGLYILITPEQYEADVEFYYVEQNNVPQPSSASGFAALASSVGLGSSRTSGRDIALAILKSRQLAASFVQSHGLLPVLFPDQWDSKRKLWNVSPSKVPTLADGARELGKFLTVTDSSDSGVVTLSVEFPNGALVAPLANDFVKMADGILRKRTLDESQQKLAYLEEQLAKTTITELRSSITNLMEQELQLTTLTKTQDNFAFKVIDPAIRPKYPAWPRRGILLVVLSFLALVAAALTSIFLDIRKAGQLS